MPDSFPLRFFGCRCGGDVFRALIYRHPIHGFRVNFECPKCGMAANGFGSLQEAFDDASDTFSELSVLGFSRFMARYYPEVNLDPDPAVPSNPVPESEVNGHE